MTRKKILLVHSRKRTERCRAEHEQFGRVSDGLAEFMCASVLNREAGWNNPSEMLEGIDAVFMGGSSDFFFHGGREESAPERAGTYEVLERIKPFVEYVVEQQIPLLGVCLGHQLVAELYGGNVTHDHSQRKMGTFDVHLTEEGKQDPIFSQMPHAFAAQYAHRDAVTTLPDGATVIASSPMCRFGALRYGERIYTMQFHPELVADDLLANAEAVSEYLPEGYQIGDVVRESPHVSALIPSFLKTTI